MELLLSLLATVTLTFGQYSFCEDGVNGYYQHFRDTGVQTVQICDDIGDKQTISTLVHELGHSYWFTVMTAEQREEYTSMYNESKWEFDYLRNLAKESAKEDFAINFESIYLEKSRYKSTKLVNRIEYIEQLIK